MLASIGLESNSVKSLVVAQRGRVFSTEERELRADLALPYIDADTAEEQRGFVTVGVPVGTKLFIARTLQDKLLDSGLWRFGWQLAGLAQQSTQAAMLVFRGSLVRRFGFVARNVDPEVSAPVLGAYDELCVWVLERILQLAGASSAQEMQQYLSQQCEQGGDPALRIESPLVLNTFGPSELENLPVLVAQLSGKDGGLGLPTTGSTCPAAYIAQLHITLRDAVLQSCEGVPGPPAGFSSFPVVASYRAACASVLEHMGESDRVKLCRPGHYTVWHWAADEGAAHDDEAAFKAVLADAMAADDDSETDQAQDRMTAPTNNNSAAHSLESEAAQHHHSWLRSLQKRLTGYITSPHVAQLYAKLLQPGQGKAGRAFSAQLRSQSGKDALSWCGYAGLQRGMTSQDTNTMLLVTMGVEPWCLSGELCPYCKFPGTSPTTAHAMVCSRQHHVGCNALHTCLKRCLQFEVLQRNGITFSNEDGSMFSDPAAQRGGVHDRTGRLYGDTVIQVHGLSLCGDDSRKKKGFIIDTSVAGVPSKKYLYGSVREPGVNSAEVDGHAAACREAKKHRHHDGRYNTCSWELVPMVQESSGRFGREASAMLELIAMHCAQRSGGSKQRIRERKSSVLRHARTTLSTALAMKTAERVTAYMRGADVLGRTVAPMSTLLSLSRDL